jgi:hypothetical protein
MAAGKAYRGSVTDPSYPRGCFFTRGDNNALTLNADAVGTGEPGLQLLCSGAARVSPGRLRHHRVRWGTHGVIWGTHGVLKAYSCCAPVRPESRPAGIRTARVDACSSLGYSRGAMGVLTGYYGLLTRYSRGTHGVLWGTPVPRIDAQGGARRGTRLDAHGRSD